MMLDIIRSKIPEEGINEFIYIDQNVNSTD